MTEQDNRLIEDYLTRVERATTGLAPARRIELIDDLREHIMVLQAEQPGAGEAHTRSILERLGDPEAIAAEAGAHLPGATGFPAGAATAPPRARLRLGTWVAVILGVLAVLLLCGSVFLLADNTGEIVNTPVPAVSEP